MRSPEISSQSLPSPNFTRIARTVALDIDLGRRLGEREVQARKLHGDVGHLENALQNSSSTHFRVPI